ncbi:MAG TPA: hypothetical protein VGL89_15540 [Candidatus Koribacter sp.]
MIFGFNTDVKFKGTVYHIQSEARQHDQHLQTQVFVRGRCIGKKATPYAEHAADPSFSDGNMHELLKAQHKGVVEAVREGRVGEVLHETYNLPTNGFTVQWNNAHSVVLDGMMVLQFHVALGGTPVSGATLISKVVFPNEPPIFAKLVSDKEGHVETRVPAQHEALDAAAIYVQAFHGEHSAVRRYRLRQVG